MVCFPFCSQLFKLLLFTKHVNSNMVDCDERDNGRYIWVEETDMVLSVVAALEMVLCGGQ